MLIKLWPSLEEKFRGTELTRLPACLPGGKRQLSTFLKSAGVQRSACLTRLREHAAYFHSNQASSAPEHPIQSRDFELWWEWNPSAVGAGWGGGSLWEPRLQQLRLGATAAADGMESNPVWEGRSWPWECLPQTSSRTLCFFKQHKRCRTPYKLLSIYSQTFEGCVPPFILHGWEFPANVSSSEPTAARINI